MERAEVIKILRFYDHIDDEIKFLNNLSMTDAQRQKETASMRAMQQEITQILIDLPFIQKNTIWDHYVKNVQWEQISYKHYYSIRQARNHANEGLKKLGKRFDESKEIKGFLSRRGEGWYTSKADK